MSKKHRGGLTRSERKLQIALARLERAKSELMNAEQSYHLLTKTVICTHPAPHYISGPFVAFCALCSWNNS